MSTICDDLRAAILQAAMQGKLTEQLPEDGKAEDLLKEIRIEKEKLIVEGKIKKQRALAPIADDEIPFSIPENWRWARMTDLFTIVTGKKDANFGSDSGKYRFFTCARTPIYSNSYSFSGESILLAGNGDIGNVSYYDGNFEAYQRTYVLQSFIEHTYAEYILRHLMGNWVEYNKDKMFGTAIPYIRLSNVEEYLIAFPPLSEQKRIVKKVDELMARVADLEQSADALASLKKAFPDDIKASLLQAAMQGKLTEQLPEDGDAEELLDQIKAEKEKLIAEGKIKKQKPLAPISDDEIPFTVPENWKWERFGNLGSYRKGPFGSALTKSIFVKDSPGSVKVYEQKNSIRKDASLGEYYISREYYENKMRSFRVLPGDIIVSCAGTIGETYVLPDGIREGIINQALMRMRMFGGIYIPYFLTYFNYIIKASAISNSKGSAIKNIPPFEILNMYPVAIPPLAEQKRIVERLDALMQNINVVGELIASE